MVARLRWDGCEPGAGAGQISTTWHHVALDAPSGGSQACSAAATCTTATGGTAAKRLRPALGRRMAMARTANNIAAHTTSVAVAALDAGEHRSVGAALPRSSLPGASLTVR